MDNTTLSSKALQETVAKQTVKADFSVCDFFGLAQEETIYAELDESAEYYGCPDVKGLEFFRWKDDGHRKELRGKLRGALAGMMAGKKYIFWPEIVFDVRDGLSTELQKLNWVLEEIYDLVLAEDGPERIYQGKIRPGKDAETALAVFYRENGEALLASAEKRAAELADDIGWFDVTAELKGSVLTGHITVDESIGSEVKYYFYLLKDGQVADKQGWFNKVANKLGLGSRRASYTWNLKESGVYCVQGYVQRGKTKEFRKSGPLSYMDEGMKQEFQAFLDEGPVGGYPYKKELELYQAEKPFANFALNISKHDDGSAMAAFVSAHPWMKLAAETSYGGLNVCALASGGVRSLPSGETLLFSGTAVLNNRIVLGTDDLPADIRPETLAASQGDHTWAWVGKNELRICADYFAMSQWYYYEDADRLVISNQYQTLLVLLRALGLRLKLDGRKAAITLASVRGNLFEYNFLRRMDVEGVFQLEIDKSFKVTSDGWEKVETENGKDARRHEVYHENQYLALLGKAAEEVKEQVRMVLGDGRWERVLLELTGGLDTRTVLGAVTNACTGALRDKLRVSSWKLPGSGDIPIATELAGIFGYSYDDLPVKQRVLTVCEADQECRRYFLGRAFDAGLLDHYNVETPWISLRGGCSESVSRPYLARALFKVRDDLISTPRRLAGYVWNVFSGNIVAADMESRKDFEEFLGNELEQIPTEDKLLAYDRLYLSYQSGYHFGTGLQYKIGMPVWLPIPSRTLLRLHNQTMRRFRGIKLELDLIAKLNPLLMNIRFENAGDNASVAEERDRLAPVDPRYEGLTISGPDDMAKWEAAEDIRINSMQQTYPAGVGMEQVQFEWTRTAETDLAALKDNLRELMKREPVLCERIGPALYYHLKKGDDAKRMRVFYNKVTSLLDQARIIEGE